MSNRVFSGGCQCGAVRYRVGQFGRASICHCRMCQKAFGNAFGPLVTGHDLQWTRGAPRHYHSSNKVRRGFCCACGTPLTYEPEGGAVEVAIATLDDPNGTPPAIQVGMEGRLDWCPSMPKLPERSSTDDNGGFYAGIVSYQHPDHDTDTWPPGRGQGN
ncbi:GFA family protein [Roseibium sp. RKSG952]|uniref:GFA family protein n=1 Tax=Roseibium sp. RKSG952 TaxID=2529384 RepID=UPI0012BD58CB|nr:GFA family protein [Roseibium sp. RKSG952]MTI00343.1 GFA family protein [Roseibium sp. RKSG952]